MERLFPSGIGCLWFGGGLQSGVAQLESDKGTWFNQSLAVGLSKQLHHSDSEGGDDDDDDGRWW